MTDYNKLTVANLRQILKDRGIASTGLTRKAQIIEKLEERDQEENAAPAETEQTPEVLEAPEAPEAPKPEVKPAEEPVQEETAPSPEALTREDQEFNSISQEDVPEPTPAADATPIEEPEKQQEAAPQSPSEPMREPSREPSREMSEALPTEKEATPDAPDDATTTADPIVQPSDTTPQTETQDFAMKDPRTPSPDPNEKQSVEKATLAPIPETSTNASIDASRLNTEELEADTKKRKRRSQSPDVASQDLRAKKPRPSEIAAENVHLKEDTDVVMEQRAPEAEVDKVEEKEEREQTEESEAVKEQSAVMEKKEKDNRYKDILPPSEPTVSAEATADDRPIFPALHPATPAIYIRDLMRPLRPDPLRKHLISLASPPNSSPDPSILKSLFLDPVRTHALVLFASTTAASRVRSSLHGCVWPPESQRKELWVDFVPEDKVDLWIQEEEGAIAAEKEARASGRPIPAKRFEVVYDEIHNDAGSAVEAVFQEVGARAPANAPRGPKASMDRFRRGSEQQGPPLPKASSDEETRKDLGKSFQTLDQLFKSTAAKPKLYFLPVSDNIADRRLDELREATSRKYNPDEKVRGRGAQFNDLNQKVRFSFDEDDRLIEVGGDFGPWKDDTGFKGGRGGGRGGRFRGGGGFRGGRGGGYRGGGRLD
ncbi:hypothetical protein BU24DRAFT_421769 [Aaosphaeria arxii CBS 175.79]|uniref:SAP domain-containing protein n=1 Tax=Aaosphaeria arxii CBS 175.79 TaxID=1450172 RepID=A0A6A5XQA7_9PLEO|nr:uncharacterized protein BU24DRAFT_421769 [Aaosphaeria arxii CBS 175.79]KAF2015465.1 hypothetical protein BU24DRAFT_421769 [Aaosphaeria arxii CBS 175.79]